MEAYSDQQTGPMSSELLSTPAVTLASFFSLRRHLTQTRLSGSSSFSFSLFLEQRKTIKTFSVFGHDSQECYVNAKNSRIPNCRCKVCHVKSVKGLLSPEVTRPQDRLYGKKLQCNIDTIMKLIDLILANTFASPLGVRVRVMHCTHHEMYFCSPLLDPY